MATAEKRAYIRLAHREPREAWPEHIRAYWHAAKESYANYQTALNFYAEYRGSSGATNGYLARLCATMEKNWTDLEDVYRPAVEEWEASVLDEQAHEDAWMSRYE